MVSVRQWLAPREPQGVCCGYAQRQATSNPM